MRGGENCTSCGTKLSRRMLQRRRNGDYGTGLCGKCWHALVRKDRRCMECGGKVARHDAKRCRLCANRAMAQDKEREARRLAAAEEARRRPDVQARRELANRRLADRKLAWCPPERRGEYLRLLKLFGTRAEAKRIIEDSMTPFERQMAKVLEGARVVPKLQLPAKEYDFTLGGVSA